MLNRLALLVLFGAFQLWLPANAQIKIGPYVQNTAADRATVVWYTQNPTSGVLRYGQTPGVWEGEINTPIDTVHVAAMVGLSAARTYYYEIAEGAVIHATGAEYYFRTHPTTNCPTPFRFAAFGDFGQDEPEQLEVRDRLQLEEYRYDFALLLGDIVYPDGSYQQYFDRYFSVYPQLIRHRPWWPALGNHDIKTDDGAPYFEYFHTPANNPQQREHYYSFDYGNAHFVSLDIELMIVEPQFSEQLAWLRSDLQDAIDRGQHWLIAMWHEAPYSGGTHSGDDLSRKNFNPIMDEFGVDLVLAGHSHAVERTYPLNNGVVANSNFSTYTKTAFAPGTIYVVSGSAGEKSVIKTANHPLMVSQIGGVHGFHLFSISGDTLRGEFITAAGGSLDNFSIIKSGLPSVQPTITLTSPNGGEFLKIGDAVNLTWTNNACFTDQVKIEYSGDGSNMWEVLASNASNAGNFNWTINTTPTALAQIRVSAANAVNPLDVSDNTFTIVYPIPAPSSLQMVTVNRSQIDFTWSDNSVDESGFTIERQINGGPFAALANVAPNVTRYLDTGLTPVTMYAYRLLSFKADGRSAYSDTLQATTWPDPPQTPADFIAFTISRSQTRLTWQSTASYEDGFEIERSKTTANAFAQIASVGAGVTSYDDMNLNANTAYFYRIRAYNLSGNSPYSAMVSTVTYPFPPVIPANLKTTTVSATQIDLTWTDKSSTETGFKIERKTGVAGVYALIATVAANAVKHSDNGLSDGTLYVYRIAAYNAGGSSAYSSESATTTVSLALLPPVNLAATVSSSAQINLSWTDQSTNEDGFKIERKTAAGLAFAEIAAVGVNVTSYFDGGLMAGTNYSYRVVAFNVARLSDYSPTVSVTTLLAPPAAPDSVGATALSKNKIRVNWKPNFSSPVDGFKIERRKGTVGAYTEIAVVNAASVSYSDSLLNANTKYFYRLRAYNGVGDSPYSSVASTTTLPFPPVIPINLKAAAASAKQITLTWTDKSSTETGFKIERKTGVAGVYAEIAKTGANAAQFIDTTLASATLYVYRICAYNSGGNSAFSNEASATTAAGPAASKSAGRLLASTNVPTQLQLSQNRPNPFSPHGRRTFGNPSTEIIYALPQDMHATLKVVNLAGQVVATLAEGDHVRGTFRVHFDASRLPAGLYFAALQAGGQTQVIRMLYLK